MLLFMMNHNDGSDGVLLWFLFKIITEEDQEKITMSYKWRRPTAGGQEETVGCFYMCLYYDIRVRKSERALVFGACAMIPLKA